MTDLEQLQILSGIKPTAEARSTDQCSGSNVSITASEKRALERKHNIRPGTEAWFKLWFSKPYLTGETPI